MFYCFENSRKGRLYFYLRIKFLCWITYLLSHVTYCAIVLSLITGETCLHMATVNERVDLMRLLLRLGADLEARERLSGMTPLHVAVERGCHSVISFLLHECKPRLDAQTYRGWTAYQLALCFNDNQLARELVRYGARPEPLSESSDSESGSEDEETLETSPAAAASYQTPIM